MKTRKGTNLIQNALIIFVIIVGAYLFLGKKYFGQYIDKIKQGNMTAFELKNVFPGLQKKVDKYNTKVGEEEKIRNEAIDAMSTR